MVQLTLYLEILLYVLNILKILSPPAVNICLNRVNNRESITIFDVVISYDCISNKIGSSIEFRGNDAESSSKTVMLTWGQLFTVGFSNSKDPNCVKDSLIAWLESNCSTMNDVILHACGDKAPEPLVLFKAPKA